MSCHEMQHRTRTAMLAKPRLGNGEGQERGTAGLKPSTTNCYNTAMTDGSEHSRRDFLKGRGARRTLADELQKWADKQVSPAPATADDRASLHVQASRRAMACDFEVQYHATDVDAADPVMEAFDLIESIVDQLTIYRARSEVVDINRSAAEGPTRVEPHLFALLEQAARLLPHASEVQNHLGIAYSMAGRDDDALAAFGRAVELDCSNRAALQNLAEAEADREGEPPLTRNQVASDPIGPESSESSDSAALPATPR